ncbi:sugar kinase [Paenibacillus dauci]|uniref:sugar kinase n=1 Tax=Paenibacillus dauci TaxID=1567106 RepID=UPI000619B24A|nr:sugar kinase [Paenibacillus dauci]
MPEIPADAQTGAGCRVAAFGEVMMRLQVPGYETLAQGSELKYTFSGTGVNITSALYRLGHDGYLVTTLPSNPLGEAAIAYLRRLGISTSLIQRGGKYIGMYFLENGFGPRPGRVTYTDRLGSSFNTAHPDHYDEEQIARRIELIHFCGITLAMNDTVRQQMKQLAVAVRRQNGQVVFDCNYRPTLWGNDSYEIARPHYEQMLEHADIVMMNERDAIGILGMDTATADRLDQLKQLIPQVAKKYDIAVIAGTHRAIHENNMHSLQGYIYKNGTFVFSQILTFPVHDRIGAGDAYTAGIIHGQLTGMDMQQMADYAATAAMLAHTVTGDTPVSTDMEIRQAMMMQGRDVDR